MRGLLHVLDRNHLHVTIIYIDIIFHRKNTMTKMYKVNLGFKLFVRWISETI